MACTEYQPGQSAPHSGRYEQRNVMGARTGTITYVQEGAELPGAPRGFSWTPLALWTAAELRAEAEEYRRLAETALTPPAMTALYKVADRLGALADRREREGGPDQPRSAMDAMIGEINHLAGMQPRPLDALIEMVKLAIATDVDAYLLIGSLIEGIGVAIAKRVPPERQRDVAVAAQRLLRDRMRTYNVI
ncbi:MAG TPA: hypothetical protein VGG99_08710 [Acetobacteraceae bacterium]|jgi:hypothetical protein